MSLRRVDYNEVCQLFQGGMARLTLIVNRDGEQFVLRELLRRNLFRWRVHRGFVKGTHIRQKLSPHPNIVDSYERGYSRFVPYEILEYVQGSNLRKLIQERNPAVKERALDILREAASALAHVHQQGILHLDVKAENFLVVVGDDKPIVKLTDFDLSLVCGSKRTRHRSGTEVYMAPEQLRKGSFLSPAADIFAFGVMAYNLVTGRMPFQGTTKRERRWKQVSDSFTLKSPLSLNPDLTPKLDWIVMRCLEKDPHKRFPSMSYLCKELGQM